MMMSQIRSQASAARRRAGGDKGFTLVELMVVVLVIAILLAIAIPTFLGARERSQDRAAQSNLRNALTAAKVAYSNDGNFGNAAHDDLSDIEPRLNYVDGGTVAATAVASSGENEISVALGGTWDAGAACFYNSTNLYAQATNCTGVTGGTVHTGYCYTGGNRSTPTPAIETRRRIPLASATTCKANSDAWTGAVWSESETCWFITDDSENVEGGTRYGQDSTIPATSCTAARARTRAIHSDW